jgi:hypothetical protein
MIAVAAFAALALPALRPAVVWAQAPATVLINHDGVDCMVANEYPRIDASLTPADQVASARVYFKSNRSAFYYVVMERTGGAHFARLARPQLDAGPIIYYLEGLSRGGGAFQTEEFSSLVVRSAEECK